MSTNETAGVLRLDGVQVAEDAESVTVRISGGAFANLAEIARIFGGWSGERVTPGSLLGLMELDGGHVANLASRASVDGGQTFAGIVFDRYRGEPGADALAASLEGAGFDLRC